MEQIYDKANCSFLISAFANHAYFMKMNLLDHQSTLLKDFNKIRVY